MAIAVVILCAITQPMIFSLCDPDVGDSDESKNRYALEARRVSGVSAGADSVIFTESKRVVSCTQV